MKGNKKEVLVGLVLILFLVLLIIVAVESYLFKKNYASADFGNIQGQAVKGYIVRNFAGKELVVDDGTVTIGIITPLSTDHYFIGESSQKGFDLATERINAEGTIQNKKIQLVYRDSGCDAEKALQAGKVLAQNTGVQFIIGADCYGYAESYQRGDEELVFLIAPPDQAVHADHFFSFEPTLAQENGFFWDNIRMKPSTMSIVFPDDEYGFAYKDALENRYTGRVLSSFAYPLSCQDFNALAEKTAARDPESLFIIGENKEQLKKIIPALRNAGYMNQVYTNLEIDNDELASMGEDRFAFEGLVIMTSFDLYSKSTKAQEFVSAYQKRYGTNPDSTASQAYDSLSILAEMIQQYGTETNQISEIMYNIRNYEGVSGLMTFSRDGIERTYYLKTIRNGKVEDY
ncbi:MAG: ABC transporter substrate-binding protein [Nanoarchaeota archaeon]